MAPARRESRLTVVSAQPITQRSDDAHVKIDATSADACQLLAGLAQSILDPFVKGPFPIEFEVAPGQTTVSYDQSEGGTSFKATITRVKG